MAKKPTNKNTTLGKGAKTAKIGITPSHLSYRKRCYICNQLWTCSQMYTRPRA